MAMSSTRGLRALLVTLAVLTALLATSAVASAATGSVSGTVKDANGAAITSADICVTAYGYDPGTGSTTTATRSTANGTYAFGALPDGTYDVWFEDCSDSSRNDLGAYYGATAAHPDSVDVVISGGNSATGIDVALAAGTSISGHVYGGAGNGTPLIGICASGGGGSTITDGSGAYTIKHVRPSGSYLVYLSACDDASPYISRYVGGDDSGNNPTTFTPTLAAPTIGADAHLTLGGAITGTVTDAAGQPITTKDVCVWASGTTSNTNYRQGTSAADGTFAIRGLRAGNYQVRYEDCGGSTRNDIPDAYGGAAPTPVAVQLGATHSGVALQLAAGTMISGHVYGGAGTGTPLKDACVSAYTTSGDASSDYTNTAADGAYTLRHLTPGVAYIVRFSPCTTSPYVAEYYDNKPDEASANPVTPPAAGTTGLDAHLSVGASFSGTVTDADGHPITTKDICVTAQPSTGNGAGSWASTTSDATGAFQLVGLTAGTYHLTFEDCGGTRNDADLRYTEAGSPDMSLVLGQAKTGIVAQMPKATSISGHVYGGAGTGTPLSGACVSVAAAASPTDTVASASTDAQGAYSVKRLSGGIPYVAHFTPCSAGSAYTGEWYSGKSSAASANAVTPTVGNPSVGIDGHLPNGASISGKVTDAAAHAITTQDICVSASPVDYTGGAHSASATTDASGNYTIIGLDPGSYYVYFTDCSSSARNDVSQYYGGVSDQRTSTIVVLSAGGAKSGVNAQFAAGTTITGTVYAGPGTSTPLGSMCVQAESSSSSTLNAYGSTNPSGSYTFSHLAPDASGYRIKVSDCTGTPSYVTQYFGGDYRRSSATVLHPTPPQPSTAVDVHVVKGASISGTVRDAAGIVTREVCVTATRYTNTFDDYYYAYGAVDAAGEYTVPALPAGTFSLDFYDCGDSRNDLEQFLASPPVAAGAAVTGVDATMQPAAAITGHVYGGAGTGHPLEDVCVVAYTNYGDDYGGYASYGWSEWAYTAADGSYTIKHLNPGQPYKVGFNSCFDGSGLAYGSQYFDGVSDLGQAATLRPTVAEPATGVDGHLPGIDAAPETTITGAPAANAATNQTSARFSFTSDQAGATFECAVDGGSYSGCASPYIMNNLSTGSHSFSVRARSNGHVDPTPPVVSWTVDPSSPTSTSQGALTSGGTFSSDPGAAPNAAVPVMADVTLPASGKVTLTKEPVTTPSANGYSVFGQQIDIAATSGDGTGTVTGSVTNPIVLAFKIDGSQIPAGTDRGAITVMRNGSPAPACSGSGGVAKPDPCISNRRDLAGGGLEIDVLTTHCSTWNFVTAPSAPAPVNTGPPVVTGSAKPGETLTASQGTWSGSGLTYAYQWLRDGAPIAGAMASTYVVTAADQGHSLAVRVTASNGSGQASATSDAANVPAAPGDTTNPGAGGGSANGGGGGGSNGGAGGSAKPPAIIASGGKPPTLTLAAIAKARLAAVAKSGLPLKLSCSRACRADVKLTIPAAAAKRLKLAKGKSAVVIGSVSASLTTKPKAVVVRLTAKAAKALRRSKGALTATLTIRVSDAQGATTTTRSVSLKR